MSFLFKSSCLTHPPPRAYIYVVQSYCACATDVYIRPSMQALFALPGTGCNSTGVVNMLDRCCPLMNAAKIYFGYDEFANKALQWLVCLYSRSRSDCTTGGRPTYRPMYTV